MTNILVTGIGGFIGAHMAHYLSQDDNNHVYGLIRTLKLESTLKALKLDENKNITIRFGNVNIYPDIEDIVTQNDIDQIYHFASQPIVRKAAYSPINTYIINVMGTANILEVVRLMKSTMNKEIPTLIQSTDKVYGNQEIPYKESNLFNSKDIYSASKACQDLMAQSYAYTYDLPIVITRPCNCYGEYDFNWSRIIPSLAMSCFDKTEKNEPLILNKDSYHHVREYIYVKDLLECLELLMNKIHDTRLKEFNISSNNELTTKQVVNKFFEFSGISKKIEFKEKETTFIEIEKQSLDTTNLLNTIKWLPKYSFDHGLEITINKYKEWFEKQNNHTNLQNIAED